MPSQWLSLLLRYVARSNDDYRSFVCFLNIQDKEGVLSAEQINSILLGISEMTDNVEQQRNLLETIIEREFKDGAGGKTNDQLRAIARSESERLLQKQLDEMKAAHKDLQNSFIDIQQQFAEHKEDTRIKMADKEQQLTEANAKIDQLTTDVQGLNKDLEKTKAAATSQDSQKEETIKQLKKELVNERGLNDFKTRRRRRIVWKSVGIVLTLVLVIWFFSSSETSDTIMGHFLAWIETLNNTQQYVAKGVLVLVFSLILFPLVISLSKDCCSKYKEE